MTLEQLNICATFFGTLTALIIFCQWKTQKRSELLSSISHSTYRDLNSFFDELNRYIEAHKYNLNIPENSEVFYGTEKELQPKVEDLYKKISTDLGLIFNGDTEKNFNNFKIQTESLFIMMYEILRKGSISKDKQAFSLNDEGDKNLRYYKIDIDETHKNINFNIDNLKKELHKYIFYK